MQDADDVLAALAEHDGDREGRAADFDHFEIAPLTE
jgi:hypothetical protein